MTDVLTARSGAVAACANPPRDDLFRALPHGIAFERDAGDGTLGTLTGHFAIFNEWTEINSLYEGRFLERIAPGAFKKTFAERGSRIKVLFQHGKDPQIGNKPLGPITQLEEDDEGAFYAVKLLDTNYNRELLPGLEAGLYGASFRFAVVKEDVVKRPARSADNPDGLPERTVLETMTVEFGPVTFPAYAGATAGVRSMTDAFRTDAPRVSVSMSGGSLYERSLDYIGRTVWAMDPPMIAVVQAIVAERAAGVTVSTDEIKARIGTRSTSPDAPEGSSVAVLSLSGPIIPHATMFSDVSGAQSIEAFQEQFREALASEDVKSILIAIDSPGGATDLVPELAAEIFAARGTKPIVAIANTMAASAAYHIASAADEIVVTPSGSVGSIGVWTAHDDISGLLEKQGVKTTLVSAGKYKTEGNPFEPLDDDAKAHLQEQVDTLYGIFVAAVAKGRGVTAKDVRDGFGQGRMVMADAAVKAGMADRVATYDETLARLEKSAGRKRDALDDDGAAAGHSDEPSRTKDADGAGKSHSEAIRLGLWLRDNELPKEAS